MNSREIEFLVADTVSGDPTLGPGQIWVIGRCLSDVSIAVGDRFDAIYRGMRSLLGGAESDAIPRRVTQVRTSLRVAGVRALNRDLDLLGVGMTEVLQARR